MNRSTEALAGPRARERAARDVAEYRPPYLAAALAALAVWALYAVTLSPTTAFWDTSEYIATAHILGIPHPPGNPTFVVLARAWELLLAPTGLPVAVRINLFSATMSALAHGFWFLVAHRILSFWGGSRWFPLVGAAVAVLVSATAFTVWNQSNVNEKVYTVSLFTIALLTWLAFRWRDNLGKGKDDNLLLLMVFILALSVGNHLMAFLAAPALVVFVLIVSPRTLTNWRLYVLAAIVAVIGLSIHFFLPLRASLDPVINEADPATMQSLWESLSRKQYDKPSMFSNPLDRRLPRDAGLFAAQLANYAQYFDWQWARSVAGNVSWFGFPRSLFTLLFVVLGLGGAVSHWRRDRTSWWYVAILFATLSFGLVFYLNFKYGFSYPGATIDMTEVRERDYFFIVGFSVWGVWCGIGLAALWGTLAEWLGRRARRPLLVTAPVLALGFIPLAFNWSWASRAHDWSARDWAYNLLMSVEPYAVLFTNGDNDTFPLWYLQEAEGIRQDVTVIVMSYLNTAWYAEQIRGLTTPCKPGQDPAADPTRILCQRPYEPEEGPEIYARMVANPDPSVPGTHLPTETILPLSDAEIDQIAKSPPWLTERPVTFRAGAIQSTIPAGRVMLPADVFLAQIVTSAIDDRPIYFATTTQSYEALGLAPFLIRQGVAYKVHNGPVNPAKLPGVHEIPQTPGTGMLGTYLDLPRTDTLLWDVFIHRSGIPDEWTHWVDRATQGIPLYYAYTHFAAAQVHGVLGDDAEVARHMERVNAWLRLARE